MLKAFKAYVCPIVEYNSSIWSPTFSGGSMGGGGGGDRPPPDLGGRGDFSKYGGIFPLDVSMLVAFYAQQSMKY